MVCVKTGGGGVARQAGVQHLLGLQVFEGFWGITEMGRKDALGKLRDVLVRRRDALRKAMAGDLSLLRELRDHGAGDVLDAAVDTAQDEINSQLLEVEGRELVQIEEALERLSAGTFGVCEECEKPIPLTRLQALPYATECIECKRKSERRGVQGRDIPLWGRPSSSSDRSGSEVDSL